MDLVTTSNQKVFALLNELEQFKIYKDKNKIEFVDFTIYKDQTEIINDVIDRLNKKNHTHNIFVVFGGNRSGKTETGALITSKIFHTMTNRRMWAATYSNLIVKTIQRKINDYLPHKLMKYADYNPVRGFKNELIIGKNNNFLYFKTFEQDVSTWQGDDLDFIWLDEECSYEHFKEAMIRLADRNGVMLMTFTSLMGFTKLVNKVWQSEDETIKNYILTAEKNPYLSDLAKKQLRASIDEDDLKSRWEGMPALKEGLIYKQFKQDVHCTERFDYMALIINNPRRYKLSEGIDPHLRTPHHYLMFLYDTQNDIIYVVEELKAPEESLSISDFSLLIKHNRGKTAKYIEYTQIDTSSNTPIPTQKVHNEEDQEDQYTIRREFLKHGIDTVLVSKDNQVGISSVKDRLFYNEKITPKLFVFNDLKGVIWEFQRYSWAKYQSTTIEERKEMINDVNKKDDHFMDIIKYEAIKRKLDLKLMENHQEKPIYKVPMAGY